MEIIETILSIAMLIFEIVLIVKLFISFKQIKELTIENRKLRNQITDLSNKQRIALMNQDRKIDQILSKINEN
jgi:hypothetical protein